MPHSRHAPAPTTAGLSMRCRRCTQLHSALQPTFRLAQQRECKVGEPESYHQLRAPPQVEPGCQAEQQAEGCQQQDASHALRAVPGLRLGHGRPFDSAACPELGRACQLAGWLVTPDCRAKRVQAPGRPTRPGGEIGPLNKQGERKKKKRVALAGCGSTAVGCGGMPRPLTARCMSSEPALRSLQLPAGWCRAGLAAGRDRHWPHANPFRLGAPPAASLCPLRPHPQPLPGAVANPPAIVMEYVAGKSLG